jgi:hypothetical protein
MVIGVTSVTYVEERFLGLVMETIVGAVERLDVKHALWIILWRLLKHAKEQFIAAEAAAYNTMENGLNKPTWRNSITMLFKKEHIEKILKGEKTQTRRTGKHQLKVDRRYRIQRSWYKWTDIEILITRRFKQKLGDITPEQAEKEGGYSVEEFRRV